MAIENLGNMNKMLSTIAQDWTKSASIDQASMPKFMNLIRIITGTAAPQAFLRSWLHHC